MFFPVISSAFLVCCLGVSATPAARRSVLSTASKPLLEWTPPSVTSSSQMIPAFQAKIDWDLDNNHTIQTPSGIRGSWWAREGYWYDPTGRQFGEILRASDNGIVTAGTTAGTEFLELLISCLVQLDDGYYAWVSHTGGAIVRQYQNGVVRVETDSPNYSWLNRIDFVSPGTFNGTEVMTINHYFPTSVNLPNGLPKYGNSTII